MDGPERDTFNEPLTCLDIVLGTYEHPDQAGGPPSPWAPVLRPDVERELDGAD
ncbi:MAG: hypothetical protein ABL908_18715 [Hyphomicrobium sp.]